MGRRKRLAPYLPAVTLLVFSLGWSMALAMQPRAGEAVVAVFPPTQSGDQALARAVSAGAEAILGFGVMPALVVADSRDPQFIEKLYGSGAWLVVRAVGADGCFNDGGGDD